VDSNGKCSIGEFRDFFEAAGARKVEAAELMRLKKSRDGAELPDYDQVAKGIGDGSLSY
jgi:hypothetical protein